MTLRLQTRSLVAASLLLFAAACAQRPQPPTLSPTAEPAASVQVGTAVTLSPGATDPAGLALSYRWTLLSAPPFSAAALDAADREHPSFTPDRAGDYSFEVRATNGLRDQGALLVVTATEGCETSPAITLDPAAPSLGQTVLVTAPQADEDGYAAGCGLAGELSFAWAVERRPAASTATLLGADGRTPSFVPDVAGSYVLALAVSDARGRTLGTARHQFDVIDACETSPAVVATPAEPKLGETVQLSAPAADETGYGDACGLRGELSYAWTLERRPAGSAARLGSATERAPSFVPDVAGTYAVALVVADARGRTLGTSRSEIVVVDPCTVAPDVVAAPAEPKLGETVQFTAPAADEAGYAAGCGLQGTLAYAWTLDRRPAGSAAQLGSATERAPSFVPDLAGSYVVTLVLTDARGRTMTPSRHELVVVDPCAQSPEIVASPAEPLFGQTVVLTAPTADAAEWAASCGLQGTVRYAWSLERLPAGSSARLNDPASRAPSFTPDVAAAYDAVLVVSDGRGRTLPPSRRTVTVSATPGCGFAPPVVEAIADTQAVVPGGRRVALTATVADADEAAACGHTETYTYAWSLVAAPAGSHARFAAADVAAPWFDADLEGTYTVRLTVHDTAGHASAVVTQDVVVAPCGLAAPEATLAAVASPVPVGGRFVLRAGATDADNVEGCDAGQTVRFAWSLESAPEGSAATLAAATSTTNAFVADVEGDYVVRVVATDSTGRSSPSVTLSVRAEACGLAVPVASATLAPATLAVGQTFTLTGAGTDTDNWAGCAATQTFTHAWQFDERPAGSTAAFADAAAATTTFVADLAGTYRVAHTVTDSTGRTSTPVRLTATAATCGQAVPAASINAPGTARLLEPVVLSATVSDADNASPCSLGQALRHDWTLSSVPAGSAATLDGAQATNPRFTPDVLGAYVVQLVVVDGAGLSSVRAERSIEVTSTCGGAAPVLTLSPATGNGAPGVPVVLHATVADSDNDAGCALDQVHEVAWALESQPAGSSAALATQAGFTTTFVPQAIGTYTLRAVASDSSGLQSATVRATVTVAACGTNPPVVAASASPARVNVGTSVALSGTASDVDSAVACGGAAAPTVAWSLRAVPAGSTATLGGAATLAATFTPDVPGLYTVEFAATDPSGLAATPVRVTVEAAACGFAAPVARIGVTSPVTVAPAATSSMSIGVNTTLSLDANGSLDQDETLGCEASTARHYAWRLVSMPGGSRAALNDPTAATPWFKPDVSGTYVVHLVATDAAGHASAAATLTVAAIGTNMIVDRSAGMFSALALDTAGNPRIAYYDANNSELRFASCVSGCATNNPVWSLPETVETFSNGWGNFSTRQEPRPIALAVDQTTGDVHLGYFHVDSCSLVYRRRTASGWSAPTTVEGGGGCRGSNNFLTANRNGPGEWVSVVLSASHRPMFAYYWTDGSTERVRFASQQAGGTFAFASVESATFSYGNGVGTWPSVDRDGGNVRVAWYDGRNNELRYAQCTSNCETAPGFSSPVTVDNGGVNGLDVGRYASLKVTAAGKVRVAYHDRDSTSLRFASCDANCTGGGSWSNRMTLDNTGDVGRFASLALASDDSPRIAYYDASARVLKLARFDGNWATSTLDATQNVGRYASLALSSSDGVRVSYWDENQDELRFLAAGL